MKWLLWPGDRICDALGLRDPDDRQTLRLFANTVVWSAVIVLVALIVA
ncbi:MAG: hypothetical protein HQL38_20030 [Alphaproteobacteria bacterium]|nr:hypothetical protein [Alphaproteobacteria bacterium]MBF0394971.1 hypothetical protein [Alphaproteobacteria bacterium]